MPEWQDTLKQLIQKRQDQDQQGTSLGDKLQNTLPQPLQGTSNAFGDNPALAEKLKQVLTGGGQEAPPPDVRSNPLYRAPIQNVPSDVAAHKRVIQSIIDANSAAPEEGYDEPDKGDMSTDISQIHAANPAEYQAQLQAIKSKYAK